MNLIKVGAVVALSVTSFSSFAERTFRNNPVTDNEISASIKSVLNQGGSKGVATHIYFASGSQEYKLVKDSATKNISWVAKGPRADLYDVSQRKIKMDGKLVKVGFHNQNFSSPSWEINIDGIDYEFIAQSAKAFDGLSDVDVKSLLVTLKPNDYGACEMVRTNAYGGVAPNHTNAALNTKISPFYETIYALIKC